MQKTEQDAGWQIVPDLNWRRLLFLEATKLVARRREGGSWVYRDPTKEEIADYISEEAW
jgi:hypothetical protein